jgi:hypothetical protein
MIRIAAMTMALAFLASMAFGNAETAVEANIAELRVIGKIAGDNVNFTLDFEIETKRANERIQLVQGDLAVKEATPTGNDMRLEYDPDEKKYSIVVANPGSRRVAISFAAQVKAVDGGGWRETSFAVPIEQVRAIEVDCDRRDLAVSLPGAVRVVRNVDEGRLTVTAIQGPDRPFVVRWRPHVEKLDAKLVASVESNTIANVAVGSLRLDSIFSFDIAQGKLKELRLGVPASLSITQVRGPHIRDWRIEPSENPDDVLKSSTLHVTLSHAQAKRYVLQVVGEQPLPVFPLEIDVPSIRPADEFQFGGHLAIGTDSAIQLLVKETRGLTQIDREGFPSIVLDPAEPRVAPKSKTFYYTHPSGQYSLRLALDRIMAAYDVAYRMTVGVREDDLIIAADLELDVRDGPLRSLSIEAPGRFVVTAVSGEQVDDYSVSETDPESGRQRIDVEFNKPFMGRTLLQVALELGRSPLDTEQRVDGLSAIGAKSQRGYILITGDEGLRIDSPSLTGLREVHPGSLPTRAVRTQYAYRFREEGWSLGLKAGKKPADLRVEAFHLLSLGEGLAYGSVAVNYYITGSPVDELHFIISPELENVDFIGSDVRRAVRSPDDNRLWTVKLQRKVIGDYNLGVSYQQRCEDGATITAGGVACNRVTTQTGHIVIASHLNLTLSPQADLGPNVFSVMRDEIPSDYRLLVNAPILEAFKYVNAPHDASLTVSAYPYGSLPSVIIDMMEAETKLSIRSEGRIESLTRLRYTIKNASGQFLPLRLPKGATLWSARIVEPTHDNKHATRRLTASFAQDTEQLMIPLPRKHNPNDPTAVEVEYGQVHGTSSEDVVLAAPSTPVRSTFDTWRVFTGEDWSIHPVAGGTTLVSKRAAGRESLSTAVSHALGAWKSGVENVVKLDETVYAGLIVLGVTIALLIFRRHAIGGVIVLTLLLSSTWIGIVATGSSSFRGGFVSIDDLTTITFTQGGSLDEKTPATVRAQVIPSWRRNATFSEAVIVPIVGVVCWLAAVILRRPRKPLIATGLACFVSGAVQFPGSLLIVGHLLTWGAPALVSIWLIVRLARSSRKTIADETAVSTAAPATLIVLCCMLSGCSEAAAHGLPPMAERPVLRDIQCDLTAGEDSMEAVIRLAYETDSPTRFILIKDGAVRLSPRQLSDGVQLRQAGSEHWIEIRKPGRHDVEAKFLFPLPPLDDRQARRFRLPIPLALTNRVSFTVPSVGRLIQAESALELSVAEQGSATVARAVFAPGEDVFFSWRPRLRQTRLEDTQYYADLTSIWQATPAGLNGRHHVALQIAQGELTEIHIRTPENVSVTSLNGPGIGAWRFDPAKHTIEARLIKAAAGRYAIAFSTQIVTAQVPYAETVSTPLVLGAARQRSRIGIIGDDSVFVTVQHPRPINADDFAQDALRLFGDKPQLAVGAMRHAFRIDQPDEAVEIKASEVRPEVRTQEYAGFDIGDERFVYNGRIVANVSKAGLFSLDVLIPADYDVDSLTSPHISHWDETGAGENRKVRVHFHQRFLGDTELSIVLSQAISDSPTEIVAPRVEVVGSVKHSGQLAVSSTRGVRLSVKQRDGVSELNPMEIGINRPGAIAFKLLSPRWQLTLVSTRVKPRITTEFLHIADVAEGLVRHAIHMRYQLQNAGSKVFDIKAPPDALGLRVVGPDIARWYAVEPEEGHWRVELTQKWYDRPYPLTIEYEKRFDRTDGNLTIEPTNAVGVDFQRGHLVVRSGPSVELSTVSVASSLQTTDARLIPRKLGGGDLSGAVFSYSTTSAKYDLKLRAKRHAAADLLEAKVLNTAIQTVVNQHGEQITSVRLELQVGGKRYLHTQIPSSAHVWTITVKGRSATPSYKKDSSGNSILLIPLDQAASGVLPVEFVYVDTAVGAWRGSQKFIGPRFDLPLTNVTWTFYVPEGFDYSDFSGTMNVDEDKSGSEVILTYDPDKYSAQLEQLNRMNQEEALRLQEKGNQLAETGKQQAAKQALESAWHYSLSNRSLNEDTRVQLNRLMRQQALVGLVGSRSRLRRQTGQAPRGEGGRAVGYGDDFNQQDAERIKNSLSKSDSENLDLITEHLIQMQHAAALSGTQLAISMPMQGRVLEFNRDLQIEPNSEMIVGFTSESATTGRIAQPVLYLFGLFVASLTVLWGVPRLIRCE